MNRLMNFSMGAFSTFLFSHSWAPSTSDHFLTTQLVSLIGGILSAICIAWLKHLWDNKNGGSALG